MHSVFLFHSIKNGLNMGIVNAGQLAIYDELPEELRDAVEDVILNRNPDATENLLNLAPKYAGKDMVNPSSVILSGVMMFEHIGWIEAAKLITKGIEGSILDKKVTYDFHRLMDNATKVSCSGFGEEIINHM